MKYLKQYLYIFIVFFVICSCSSEDEQNIVVINGKLSKGVWYNIPNSVYEETMFMLVTEGYIVRTVYYSRAVSIAYIPGEPPVSWVEQLIEKNRQSS